MTLGIFEIKIYYCGEYPYNFTIEELRLGWLKPHYGISHSMINRDIMIDRLINNRVREPG